MSPSFDDQLPNPRRIFVWLVLYRWISLIPPLVVLGVTLVNGESWEPGAIALVIASILNVLISLFHRSLNRIVSRYQWLLVFDLIMVALVVALTGGWRTPYYLYSLSPLLAAAFFFQFRGAMVATTAFLPMYLAAIIIENQLNGEPPSWLVLIMAVVGFYSVSGAIGYAFSLVQQLEGARDELAEAHRDLEVIHDLTISLQSASDVNEVEERVLEAVTQELNYSRAVVALVDSSHRAISAWMGQSHDGNHGSDLPHSFEIPLNEEGGVISQALLSGVSRLGVREPLTTDKTINAHLGMENVHIFPLMLRDNPVGVLLVDADHGRNEPAKLQSLEAITNQAAVSLGATMMCIDRAQRLAVQEERLRIAQDIHDTVSQSLFGIVYTLDGTLKMLDSQPEAVEPELRRVLEVAEETRAEVRKSILDMWPSELTAEKFVQDLQKYAVNVCQADQLAIHFDVSGDFSQLSSRTRRSLYRISQEALANTAHHAIASEAHVCVEVTAHQVVLSARDNGRGFDPDLALKREYGREHFGLWGMRDRAQSHGGTCEIISQPGAGTSIIVDIPI